MAQISERRQDIHEHFRKSQACQKHFRRPENYEDFVAYEVSLLLIQDSTEGLWQHREKGFSPNSLIAYIELWGVLQATAIQQDAISQLYEVILKKQIDFERSDLENWRKVRDLRHTCAGHPVRKNQPKGTPLTRTFMSRDFGSYESFSYETWQREIGTSWPAIKLGALLDSYAAEAALKLEEIHSVMKELWP